MTTPPSWSPPPNPAAWGQGPERGQPQVYGQPHPEQQWPQQYPPQQYSQHQYPPQPPPQKTRKWPWVVGGIVVFLIVVGSCGRSGTTSTSTTSPTVPSSAAPTPAQQPAAAVEPAAPAAPTARDGIGDGTFIVGEDIERGTYRSAGAKSGLFEFCAWSTLSGAASNSDILDFGSANADEPMVVEIGSKVKAFKSSGCEPWVKVK